MPEAYSQGETPFADNLRTVCGHFADSLRTLWQTLFFYIGGQPFLWRTLGGHVADTFADSLRTICGQEIGQSQGLNPVFQIMPEASPCKQASQA